MSFENMLRELSAELGEASAAKRPDISPEGKLARLREYAERAGTRCPFAPGDIVTPRRGGLTKQQFCGEPNIVLEVFPEIFVAEGEQGGPEFLRRYDMRLVSYDSKRDIVLEKIAASWEFEKWGPQA